jgi:hypothetical protein
MDFYWPTGGFLRVKPKLAHFRTGDFGTPKANRCCTFGRIHVPITREYGRTNYGSTSTTQTSIAHVVYHWYSYCRPGKNARGAPSHATGSECTRVECTPKSLCGELKI